MKKIVVSLFSLLFVISLLSPVAASSAATQVEAIRESSSTRAEETIWYYRVYNGKLQKRQWSVTESRWLTDWEDC